MGIPVCPTLEEIGLGERFGTFDLTMIHILVRAVFIDVL